MTLSADEQTTLQQLIESIYVHHAMDIHVTQTTLASLKTMFSEVDSSQISTTIFEHLDQESQIALAKTLDIPTLGAIFALYHNMHHLYILFSSLSPDTQNQVLAFLKKHHPDKFNQLQTKEVAQAPSPTTTPNDAPKTASIDGLDPDPYKGALLLFQTSTYTVQDAEHYAKTVIRQLSNPDLNSLCQKIITTIKTKKLSLSNKKAFALYLKTYFFFDPILMQLPSTAKFLPPHLDPLIVALNAMPDHQWKLKILNQLPFNILKITLRLLKNHEKMAHFEKRNLYCKVYNDISSVLNQPEAKRIKQALPLT